MESRLQELDSITPDEVHEAVFASESARPGACEVVLQRFGLAESCEGFAKYGFDEFQRADGDVSVLSDPIEQVFAELRMEDRLARTRRLAGRISLFRQGRVLDAMNRPSRPAACVCGRE